VAWPYSRPSGAHDALGFADCKLALLRKTLLSIARSHLILSLKVPHPLRALPVSVSIKRK
jgi:hypothetical protein